MFLETIDQLLNYLTWRDSKTAIILFVRDTAIGTVLAKIPELLRSHPAFLREDAPRKEDEFRCRMKNLRDESLSLDVTVQVYHVPKKNNS